MGCARAVVIAAGLLFAALGMAQEKKLPTGFGGIHIGDPWEQVSTKVSYELIDSLTTPWDRYLNECGYQSVRVYADNAVLLITVNDFVVTELNYEIPIRPGADLMEAAALVEKNYGPPAVRKMRTLFGRETELSSEAEFITLAYRNPHQVEFSISGAKLWRYQITARSPDASWHANKSLLCAREKEKQADLRAKQPNQTH